MSRVATIALNTHRETVRDRVLYNLVLFALIMIGSSYVLGQISIRQEVKIIKDLGLASIEVFGTVIAIFIGIGLVSKEIERRTLYSVLAKPVARHHFILGKYLGLCLTLGVNLAIMAAGFYALLAYMTKGFDPAYLKALYLLYLQFALVTALAILFSTFTTSTLAGIFTGFLFVAGHFSRDLRDFDVVVVESPVLPIVTRAIYYLLPNFGNFDVKARVVAEDPIPLSLVGYSSAYALLYIAALLILATTVFSKRELT